MINDVGEKRENGREKGRGTVCFFVSWLVNHIPLQEIQHQRLQYQTMPNGMCTASITNDIAATAIFFFLFFAQVVLFQTRYARKGHWPS